MTVGPEHPDFRGSTAVVPAFDPWTPRRHEGEGHRSYGEPQPSGVFDPHWDEVFDGDDWQSVATVNRRRSPFDVASYDPDDDKLRLFCDKRVSDELYAELKKLTFQRAHQQGCWYATWTPEREDFVLGLCDEIGPEETTLADRAEARQERFDTYQGNRRREARSALEGVKHIIDGRELGQPIICGHHSEQGARRDQKKVENAMRRAGGQWATAEYWDRRAAGVERYAEFKTAPAVRFRRIKTITAERRTHQRDIKKPSKAGGGTVGHERIIARAERWIAHLDMRIAYENACIAASGWKAPEKKKKVLAPILNYRQEVIVTDSPYRSDPYHCSQVEMTRAEYKAKDKDSKACRRVRGGHHRVRIVQDVRDHKLRISVVFLTDSKEHDVPEKPEPKPIILPPLVLPVERVEPPVEPDAEVFAGLKKSLVAGVQIVVAEQLFETPPALARRAVELAELQPGDRVHEPSAGTGRLLAAVYEKLGSRPTALETVKTSATEINHRLASGLRSRFPDVEITTTDFLTQPLPPTGVEIMVMNPPFRDGADIKHILRAVEWVEAAGDGRVVAFCANGPRQHKALRHLADRWEELEPGSFRSSGTNVSAVLLTIEVG